MNPLIYLTGGLGITTILLGLSTWLMWEKYDAELSLRVKAETAAAIQAETIKTMAENVRAAKEELSVLEAAHKDVDLLRQRREAEINELRLTLAQQAYEAPYRSSVDIHNWLARWMRDIEAAGGGRPAGAVDHSADPASADPVATGAD